MADNQPVADQTPPTPTQQLTPPQTVTPVYQPVIPGTTQTPSGTVTIQNREYIPWRAISKLGAAILLLVLVVTASIILGPKIFKPASPMGNEENILLTTNYKPVVWKDFGNVFEPQVTIPVQYPVEGFQDVDFLLDSGAVVSSLPREEAKKLGLSLAKLPRSTFSGFGGMLSFAYRGKITVLLGTEEFVVPVVFTEAAGTKPLFGRSGFFEQFSVYFNHEAKRIEIRK